MDPREQEIREALDWPNGVDVGIGSDVVYLLSALDAARQERDKWKAEHQFQAELTKALLPYQDRAVEAERQLAEARAENARIKERIVSAAKRQREAVEKGYLSHALICNYQRLDVSFCNCGLANLQQLARDVALSPAAPEPGAGLAGTPTCDGKPWKFEGRDVLPGDIAHCQACFEAEAAPSPGAEGRS